ncbi:MAG: hypothetical protein Q8P35_00445 [Candidatus Yanofskybacteria bacterium]|nr:hypothetical protein [Candidatus Yanofskybacteria bacterium]
MDQTFLGPFCFLSNDTDQLRTIYNRLKDELTDLERHALLYYLVLPIPRELNVANERATEQERETARRIFMQKLKALEL